MSDIETPATETNEDDLLRQLKQWFEDARTGSQDWRDEAKECFRFDSGDQWDEKTKQELKEQNRPVVVFNRVHSVKSSVCGLEIGNRQEIRVVPRETGDNAAAEVATAHLDWQRETCNAGNEESDAFDDMVTCGMGWTETRMDMEEDPQGMTRIERIDPLEMFWDPASQKKNLQDAKFVMRIRALSYEDAQAEFPDADRGDLNAGWADDVPNDKPISDDRDYPADGDEDNLDPKRTCRIVQVQWWERVAIWRVQGPNGLEELDKDQYATMQERGMPVRGVKATKRIFKQAFVGSKVLETGPGPCEYEFTLQCMTAKRDQATRCWYGLLRHMMDPQRWANKWLSQTMHVINSNAKGGVLVEQSAMVNPRKFQAEWSKPDSVSVVADGTLAGNRLEFKPAITYPSGLDKLMEFAIMSIRDTSGVNLELLGLADRQQAGVLEAQRKKSALTILAQFFDALSLYRRRNGRTLLYFMKEYYDPQRIARVVGIDEQQIQMIQQAQDPMVQQAAQMGDPQAQQMVQQAQSPDAQKMMAMAKVIPQIQQIETIRYDIQVDEAPASPNQKEMVWAMFMQMPQIWNLLPPQAIASLLKYSPLPESVAQEIAPFMAPPPDPMVEHAKETELMQKDADVQKTSGEARKVNAEAVQAEMETQVGAQMLRRGVGPWSKPDMQKKINMSNGRG